MPAFTFEKISPPVRRGPIPPIAKKQRGVIVQILDRFVEARVKRTSAGGKGRHRPQRRQSTPGRRMRVSQSSFRSAIRERRISEPDARN